MVNQAAACTPMPEATTASRARKPKTVALAWVGVITEGEGEEDEGDLVLLRGRDPAEVERPMDKVAAVRPRRPSGSGLPMGRSKTRGAMTLSTSAASRPPGGGASEGPPGTHCFSPARKGGKLAGRQREIFRASVH